MTRRCEKPSTLERLEELKKDFTAQTLPVYNVLKKDFVDIIIDHLKGAGP